MRTYLLSWELHGGNTTMIYSPPMRYLPQHAEITIQITIQDEISDEETANRIVLPLDPPKCHDLTFQNIIMPFQLSPKVLIHSRINPNVQVQSLICGKASPFCLRICKIESELVTSFRQWGYRHWVNTPISNGRHWPKQRVYRSHASLNSNRAIVKL